MVPWSPGEDSEEEGISPRKWHVRVPCWAAADRRKSRINQWEEGEIGNEGRQEMLSAAVGEGRL